MHNVSNKQLCSATAAASRAVKEGCALELWAADLGVVGQHTVRVVLLDIRVIEIFVHLVTLDCWIH